MAKPSILKTTLIWMTTVFAPSNISLNATGLAPVTREGVTVRCVEAGIFQASRVQGLEMEVVNASARAVKVDVTLRLQRQTPPATEAILIQEVVKEGVALFPNTRQGFRVAEPLTFGTCWAECCIAIDGKQWVDRRLKFDSPGPYQLTVRPYLLSLDAFMAQVTPLDTEDKISRLVYRLVHPITGKVLFQSDQFRRIKLPNTYTHSGRTVMYECLLSLKGQPPGEYRVEAEIVAKDVSGAKRVAWLHCQLQRS